MGPLLRFYVNNYNFYFRKNVSPFVGHRTHCKLHTCKRGARLESICKTWLGQARSDSGPVRPRTRLSVPWSEKINSIQNNKKILDLAIRVHILDRKSVV